MHVERYEHAGELLAVRIGPAPVTGEGFRLVSEPGDTLQVGRNRRPAGYRVRAHVHPPESRRPAPPAAPRQEMLHVLSGRVRVELHAADGTPGPVVEARAGDTLWLRAGHGVTFLEESELVEVKEGPYPGPEADKKFL